MRRDATLAVGETYHIFNRGAHKQNIFTGDEDYQRFMLLLHVANTSGSVNMRELFSKYQGQSFADIYTLEKPDKSHVEVLAYCLMPNHFHLVLRQKSDAGISVFLRKVMTAYSMYFNTKYGHSGVLWQGPFKSKHIDSEPYFRYIFSYVHLNPLSYVEPNWEIGEWRDRNAASQFVTGYRFSSFVDYTVAERPERAILAYEQKPDFLSDQNEVEEILREYEGYDPFTKVSPL